MSTANEAVLDMFQIIQDVADEAGLAVSYPLTDFSIPADAPWARVTVRHGFGGQSSLTGGLGKAKFGHQGTLWIQTFWPYGKASQGLLDQLAVCQQLLSAFQNVQTEHCVWFRNQRFREIGQDGDFYNVNVLIDFEYEQIN